MLRYKEAMTYLTQTPDSHTDRPTERQTDRQTYQQTDRRTNRLTETDVWSRFVATGKSTLERPKGGKTGKRRIKKTWDEREADQNRVSYMETS